MSDTPTIHRLPAKHEGAFVNAYLVETEAGVVAVDGLLTVSVAREMRTALDRLGKPLHAVLLTQTSVTVGRWDATCGSGNAATSKTFLDAGADADWSEPESAKAAQAPSP